MARVLSWEHGRLRQAMPLVVRRCMSFSAMPCFDDALIAAAKEFYGLDMDVATAEAEILEDDDERVRFFPWFLWDWRVAPGLPTVGERFAREEEHASHERRLLEGLCASYVGLYETLADPTEAGVRVRDLATGEDIDVTDDGLVGEVAMGQILQARLVRVPGPSEGCVLVDAVYAVLPVEARGPLLAEIDSLPREIGGVGAALQACTAELLELAEHMLERLAQPPMAVNADGEQLLLCQLTLRGESAERALGATAADAGFKREGDGLWCWRPTGEVLGFVHRARDGRAVLGATSVRRLDALTDAVAGLVGSPEGPCLRSVTDYALAVESWASRGGGDLWLRACPDVMRATERWVQSWAASWADVPWQELGDRTPREASRVAEGRRRLEQALSRMERRHRKGPGLAAAMEVAALRLELGLHESL